MSSSESGSVSPSSFRDVASEDASNSDFDQFLEENDENPLKYHDSDDEEDDDERMENGGEVDEALGGDNVSSEEIESLRDELQNSPSVTTCRKVMSLLKSSVSRSTKEQQLVIVDGGLFNEIMKLCLVDLLPALGNILKLPASSETHALDPSKSKLWKKLLTSVKSYLIDMLKITSYISEPMTFQLVLKHLMHLVPYYVQFVKLSRVLVKKMIHIWSTADEKARILAFVVMYRVLKRLPDQYHTQVLKQTYFAFVKNTKFATPTSFPLISFMKRSLTEMYACHPEVAYEHAFLYLRQLCIHLRNGLTMKKKESYQTVYNWQFIHCVILWSNIVSQLYHFEPMKTLAYPLVQLAIGTINLIPTLKYVPLRFHLVKALIAFSASTGVFVPIPPLIIDVFSFIDPNKKLAFAKKPVNLDYALKLSKSQLQESGHLDSIVGDVCTLLSDFFTTYSASVSFPELAFFTIHQMKSFCKKNKVAKYGQQLKAVLDKLQQNSNYISQQRNSVSFEITDTDKIKDWEEDLRKRGTLFSNVQESAKRAAPTNTEPPKKKKKFK